MPASPTIQKGNGIELNSFEISVCKNKNLQPYYNVFHFNGANFNEQRLGELFGIIQIFDESKNSAYLPNLIAQVIKKEFYSNTKRSVEQSFEAALHKANLALTDLAQHEIIEWIGKLNAVIGIIQKNNFYFTQSGGGKILLIRNKLITEISRGLDDGSGMGHPIKTFSNISFGKIQPLDKVIFASETMFECLSWEELKRHITVFSSNEFDNIVKSTVELEGNQVGIIIINSEEKAPAAEIKDKTPLDTNKKINFFGTDLEKKDSLNINNQTPEKEKKTKRDDLKEPVPSFNDNSQLSPFEKEPELFIKEDNEPEESARDHGSRFNLLVGSMWNNTLSWTKKCLLKSCSISTDLLLRIKSSSKNLGFKLIQQFKKTPVIDKDKTNQEPPSNNLTESQVFLQSNANSNNQPRTEKSKTSVTVIFKTQLQKYFQRLCRLMQTSLLWLKPKPFQSSQKKSQDPAKPTLRFSFPLYLNKKFLAGAFLGITLVFSVFFSIVKNHNSKTVTTSNSPAEQKNETYFQVPEDINSALIDKLNHFSKIDSPVTKITGLRDELFILTQDNSFYKFDIKSSQIEKINMPGNVQRIVTITEMPPLRLIFLLTKDSIYSYSPVTRRFDNNSIELPDNLDLISAGTYLTYLYLLDRNTGQIYQYYRSAGGFKFRQKWFEDNENMENAKQMAISDSIYIIFPGQSDSIKKYFKNKRQSFSIQSSQTPINPSNIVAPDDEEIFVLDNVNGRIIQISKDGSIIKQFWNKSLIDAKDLWFDVTSKNVFYVDGDNQLVSFGI